MHLRAFQNTTSSIVAELCADPNRPLRAWVGPGQPCVSVYVPVFPPHAVPEAPADPSVWHRFEALRNRVEGDGGALEAVRAVFGPLEAQLWAEADGVGGAVAAQRAFVEEAWQRVEEGLRQVERPG
jgi:hypothetical protein